MYAHCTRSNWVRTDINKRKITGKSKNRAEWEKSIKEEKVHV